jgi:hypothetical protein
MLENALDHHDGHLTVVGDLADASHRARAVIHLMDSIRVLPQNILGTFELGLGSKGITDKTAKQ